MWSLIDYFKVRWEFYQVFGKLPFFCSQTEVQSRLNQLNASMEDGLRRLENHRSNHPTMNEEEALNRAQLVKSVAEVQAKLTYAQNLALWCGFELPEEPSKS